MSISGASVGGFCPRRVLLLRWGSPWVSVQPLRGVFPRRKRRVLAGGLSQPLLRAEGPCAPSPLGFVTLLRGVFATPQSLRPVGRVLPSPPRGESPVRTLPTATSSWLP